MKHNPLICLYGKFGIKQQNIVAFRPRGGATEPYQTPSWVTVFIAVDHPPPHLPSMWVSVFELKKLTPPHLPSMWVSVFESKKLTPPHLTSMWVSVF